MNFDEFVDSGMYDELCHYGIPGMKWGVRRTPEELGHRKSTSKKAKTSELRRKREKDLKNRRFLSDSELKKKVERLRLEKEFKNLALEDLEKNKESGKEYLNNIMKDVGKTALTSIATGAAYYAVKAALTREFDPRELAKYIVPKKK